MLFPDRTDANLKSSAEAQQRHECGDTIVERAYRHMLLRLLLLRSAQIATPHEGDVQQAAGIPEPPMFGPAVSVMLHTNETAN